jgi:hypothetical protein
VLPWGGVHKQTNKQTNKQVREVHRCSSGFRGVVVGGLLNEDCSGTAWFALIVRLSLSLSVLVAIVKIAAENRGVMCICSR